MLNEGAWPVAEMCSALKVTRQGCCAWRRRPPGARGRRDAGPSAKISEICAASRGVYGAPKVFAELRRAGVRTPRKRAARLMRENGRAGTTRGCARRPKGERKAAAPQASAAPDLVRRDKVNIKIDDRVTVPSSLARLHNRHWRHRTFAAFDHPSLLLSAGRSLSL